MATPANTHSDPDTHTCTHTHTDRHGHRLTQNMLLHIPFCATSITTTHFAILHTTIHAPHTDKSGSVLIKMTTAAGTESADSHHSLHLSVSDTGTKARRGHTHNVQTTFCIDGKASLFATWRSHTCLYPVTHKVSAKIPGGEHLSHRH